MSLSGDAALAAGDSWHQLQLRTFETAYSNIETGSAVELSVESIDRLRHNDIT